MLIEIKFNRHTACEGEIIDVCNGEDHNNVKVIISSVNNTCEEMSDDQANFIRRELNPDID